VIINTKLIYIYGQKPENMSYRTTTLKHLQLDNKQRIGTTTGNKTWNGLARKH